MALTSLMVATFLVIVVSSQFKQINDFKAYQVRQDSLLVNNMYLIEAMDKNASIGFSYFGYKNVVDIDSFSTYVWSNVAFDSNLVQVFNTIKWHDFSTDSTYIEWQTKQQ